ncbi:DUF4124 domain-containing protein [Leeia sp.]|uniref:DUF4124 domain-containing protein n=1 Tax=Leeia sp. TaxID=2884678 RepID=UPI0035B4120B
MRISTLGLLLCLLTPAAHAAMYKCAINGKTTYSSTPCDGGQQQVMEAPKPAPKTEREKTLSEINTQFKAIQGELRSECRVAASNQARLLKLRPHNESRLYHDAEAEYKKADFSKFAGGLLEKTYASMMVAYAKNPSLSEGELAVAGSAYCISLVPTSFQ